jgi:bifunctional DNA-binding transcriptional regulator/antitoxin component of YhaV-PrlF toxin-antitoxin module
MFAVEIETVIDRSGQVQLPEQYRRLYGKSARIQVLVADESPTMSIARLSEPALEKIWNNPDDAVYDQL